MEPLGWVFLVSSMVFVVGLTAWCYAKLLRAPRRPPEEFEDFHSA